MEVACPWCGLDKSRWRFLMIPMEVCPCLAFEWLLIGCNLRWSATAFDFDAVDPGFLDD
jgi:hypothetical protein